MTTPAPLASLCHDALAKGVLEAHNGLPDSWLALFQKHPAAWAQIEKRVLCPRGRPDPHWLTKDSTVLVVYDRTVAEPDVETAFRQKNHLLPASALPEWLFKLLASWSESLFYSDEWSFSYPLQCGLGGYRIALEREDHAFELYTKMKRMWRACGGGMQALEEDFYECFFKAQKIDPSHAYRREIAKANVDDGFPADDDDDWPLSCLVGEFPSRTHAIMRKSMRRGWQKSLEKIRKAVHARKGAKQRATYMRRPFATLYVPCHKT